MFLKSKISDVLCNAYISLHGTWTSKPYYLLKMKLFEIYPSHSIKLV